MTDLSEPTDPPVKKLAVDPDRAPPMVPPLGLGVATDHVMVEGWPVQSMRRGPPAHEADSGWTFASGLESSDELADPKRAGAYDLDLIANIDPDVLPFLTWPPGTVVERSTPSSPLEVVEGPEQPPEVRLLPPVGPGPVRFSDAWRFMAPTRLLRWLDGADLVLWRPGLQAMLAVYDGPADPAARLAELAAQVHPDATHVERSVQGGLARLSFRLEEAGSAAIFGFLRTADHELHVALHFDDEQAEAHARAMLATAAHVADEVQA